MAFKHGRTYWGYLKPRNGSRKRVSLGTDDKNLARTIEAMLDQLRGLREWEILDRVVDGFVTVGEVYDHWRKGDEGLDLLKATISDVDLNLLVDGWKAWARRRAAADTVEKYARQLRRLMPEGKAFKRSQFTRRNISAGLAGLSCSGSTARRHHAAWSSFANYLVETEVIPINPLRGIRAPSANPPRELHFPLSDCIRLVEAQPMPYRALAALREGAGVEISAALAVNLSDLDHDNRTVHIHGTKNPWRDRIVLVEEWAWPFLLAAAKGKVGNARLFIEESGHGAAYGRARSEHRAALKALALNPHYTMHDARHSFAVRWMKAGHDPQLIANNLGHRDASMVLRIYGKYRPKAADYLRVSGGRHG